MNRLIRQQKVTLPGWFKGCMLGLTLISGWLPFDAMAVLALDPTRIVFEGRTRSETVTIINQNPHPATYRIRFQNKRVLENGSYTDVTTPEPGEPFADKLIRYSPRQVTVEPGKTQSVRLLLRKPRNLAEGEYRSHLVVEEVPDPNIGSDIEKLDLKDGEVSVSLIARFAISIPVIVRHGQRRVASSIADVELRQGRDNTPPSLSLNILRSGNQSLYGDLSVVHVMQDGREQQVGITKGIAVHVPNTSRVARIPLTMPQAAELQGGELKVRYKAKPKAGGDLLAEASLSLPE